ncbi:MAG: hypothetical protein QOH36_1276 [Actinomycetota bacterium]|nr:hypothetical protein [Actinomycetota bacterium]
MRRLPLFRAGASQESGIGASVLDDPETVRIPLVDEVHAIAAPEIDLWTTKAHDLGSIEQRHLWRAEGEARSRQPEAARRRLGPAADAEELLILGARDQAKAALDQLGRARTILRPHVVRPRFDDIRYYIALILLFGGDVAGGTGAAIALGEVIWLAVVQMLAVGAAGVCLGGLASEAKYARTSRTRAKAGVPASAKELGLGYLFLSPDPGEAIVRRVLIVGCVGVALIGVGIGTLRWSTDGWAAGLVFGCLAAAVVLGSAANSYVHADQVSDVLDGFERDHHQAVRELLRAGRRSELSKRAEYQSLAASHLRETDGRGLGAATHVLRHGLEVLSNNPAAAGNGTPTARTAIAGAPDLATALQGANSEPDPHRNGHVTATHRGGL